MSKAKVYEVLLRYSDIFAGKPSKFTLTYLSEKLEDANPKTLDDALSKYAESNKYFPIFKEIQDAVREIERTSPRKASPCERCSGTGTVVLFHKEMANSACFSCRCINGNQYREKMRSEEFSGSSWIEPRYFKDPRIGMTTEQLAEHLAKYWEFVFRSSETALQKAQSSCDDAEAVSF